MNANKAFSLLFSSFVVALIGLTTLLIKTLPLTFSHVVYVCQKTFSNVLFSVSHSIPISLLVVILVTLFIGLITLAVQVAKTRAYLKRSLGKRVKFSNNLQELLKELNLIGRVDVVKDEKRFSFCYGLLLPRICLSTSLLKALSKNELKAVLLHETYHLKNNDPLKVILGRTASIMFFFIPVLRDIQNYYAFSKEIAADELVIKKGAKFSLISVLTKLLASGSSQFAGVAALASTNDLEKRILYLTGKQNKISFRPSTANISLSAFVVMFALIVVNAPVYALNLHEESMDNHSLFICPFGDSCKASCKAEEKINYSKNLLYTPKNVTK